MAITPLPPRRAVKRVLDIMKHKTMGKFALILLGLSLAVFFVSTKHSVALAEGAPSATPTPTPAVAPTIKDDTEDVIKVETNLVNLNVRVVDRNGRPINDLKQSDFTVFEEGAPQR